MGGRKINEFMQKSIQAKRNGDASFVYKGATYHRMTGGKKNQLVYYKKQQSGM